MTLAAAPVRPEVSLQGDTLSLHGPMTLLHARALELAGAKALQGEVLAVTARLVADLAAVTAVDSSALAVLFALQRALQQRGGSLAVRAAPDALLSLAKVYGVEDQLVWA